ncbi:DUF4397 domain-containing protein [Mucilaginibacter conchicola]|uniref:DUF4397 domain-containing protein n=1 Tax=Mucilaginibacter conchicola TaxID=2303333 RepID=A0A372NYE8_9SPHI|nr:DUF4397 domain-containing protein [Mucilaginibacter conchicola]RFZ95130.1 DUF4397 domain-containing protein [Mucilaginibacter conchicola]
MKLKLFFIAVFTVVCAFVACKKGDDSIGIKQYTSVNFINATADTVNVYVNGSRVNTTNSLYPLGASGYINSLLGEQNYQVRKAGKPDVLFSLPASLDSGKVYSFYIAGNSPGQAFTDVDTLKNTPDTLLLRFVHTSPNLGQVDVRVGNTVDTLLFSNRDFKTTSPFVAVGPGIKRIRIYKAGTSTLLSDDTFTLNDNRAYTLFTKSGLSANGGSASGAKILTYR